MPAAAKTSPDAGAHRAVGAEHHHLADLSCHESSPARRGPCLSTCKRRLKRPLSRRCADISQRFRDVPRQFCVSRFSIPVNQSTGAIRTAMVIVLKADVRSDSPEVAADRRARRELPRRLDARPRRAGRDALAHRDLSPRPDARRADDAVRGVRGGREGRAHHREVPRHRPPRRPARVARLRVQRRHLLARHAARLPRAVRRRQRRRTSRRPSARSPSTASSPRAPAPTSRAPRRTTSRATAPPACPTCSSSPASTASASSPWRSRDEAHIDEIRSALAATGNATGVMLQIGTRNAQNFELLKAVGAQNDMPVLFKRGMGISLEDSLNACEYVASGGNHRIVFGLRGMKTQPRRSAPQLRRLRARAGGQAHDAPAGVHRSVALGRAPRASRPTGCSTSSTSPRRR